MQDILPFLHTYLTSEYFWESSQNDVTSFWEDSLFHCLITERAWRDSHFDAEVLSNSVEFPPHAHFIRRCYNVHY